MDNEDSKDASVQSDGEGNLADGKKLWFVGRLAAKMTVCGDKVSLEFDVNSPTFSALAKTLPSVGCSPIILNYDPC